jgi:Dullard-like phosphatase family protein
MCSKGQKTEKKLLANSTERLAQQGARAARGTRAVNAGKYASGGNQHSQSWSFMSRMRSFLRLGAPSVRNRDSNSKSACAGTCFEYDRNNRGMETKGAENLRKTVPQTSTESLGNPQISLKQKITDPGNVRGSDSEQQARSGTIKNLDAPVAETAPTSEVQCGSREDDLCRSRHCPGSDSYPAEFFPASSLWPDRDDDQSKQATSLRSTQLLEEPHKRDSNPSTGTPLLPPQKDIHRGLKTLVLDLDETLVHSGFDKIDRPDYVLQIEVNGILRTLYVKKRPGCDRFLREMADYFEIVVFTASLAKYADAVCDLLNQSVGRDVISYRLFRDSCEFDVDALCFVKNLHYLGRDIRKIVIVDNSPSAYLKNAENAIPVVSWFNDESDNTLEALIPLLQEIAAADDVRDAIQKSPIVQKLRENFGSIAGETSYAQ